MVGQALALVGGATVGGAANYLANKDAARQYDRAMNAYNADMANYLSGYQSSTQRAIDQYDQQARQYLNSPDKVAQWLNPNMDYQLQQVANANNMQYAAGGKMLSGAAMKSLQDRSQNVAKLSWQDAFNNMNASNNQGLGFAGNMANMRTDMSGNLFNAQQGMAANQMSAAMGQPQTGFSSFLTGATQGMNLGTGLVNAFRTSPTAPGTTTQGSGGQG